METDTAVKQWEAIRQAIYELAEFVPDSRLERIDALADQLAYELEDC